MHWRYRAWHTFAMSLRLFVYILFSFFNISLIYCIYLNHHVTDPASCRTVVVFSGSVVAFAKQTLDIRIWTPKHLPRFRFSGFLSHQSWPDIWTISGKTLAIEDQLVAFWGCLYAELCPCFIAPSTAIDATAAWDVFISRGDVICFTRPRAFKLLHEQSKNSCVSICCLGSYGILPSCMAIIS